jgi:hypothetical protein
VETYSSKGWQPKPKTADKKIYHYCPNHKAWCIHTMQECKLRQEASPTPTSSKASNGSTLTEDDILVIKRAYHAIVHDFDDDSQNNDDD